MREMLSLTAWRLPHWLILTGSALYLITYVGLIPPPHDVMSWLETRPEVASAFHDPNFGRADALILVFSTLFLGPLALLLMLVFGAFTLAVLAGFVRPFVRWFALPDWVANVAVVLIVVGVAYLERELWMPQSLWFLGLLARACRVVIA